MSRVMKIAIFGGSFDPVHYGHLFVARAAAKQFSLDKIFFVPAAVPPHKTPKKLAPPSARLAMLRSAVKGEKKFSIDDFELRRRRPTYTYETISRFKRKYPFAEIFFILGADMLADLPSWKKGSSLTDMCHFIAAARPGVAFPKNKKVLRVKNVFSRVSSTAARAAAARPAVLSKLVPPPVAAIIRARSLYLDDEVTRFLAARLDRAKFQHTAGVVSVAENLAKRFGADPYRARLAALIHDMGRIIAPARYRQYAGAHRLPRRPSEETVRASPFLLHSYISAHLAEIFFGISDRAVLAAAANHTLGPRRRGATIYDKIIYIADAVSPDRRFPGAAKIRRAAFRSLDDGMRLCAAMKLSYVIKKKQWLAPEGVAVYNDWMASVVRRKK